MQFDRFPRAAVSAMIRLSLGSLSPSRDNWDRSVVVNKNVIGITLVVSQRTRIGIDDSFRANSKRYQ